MDPNGALFFCKDNDGGCCKSALDGMAGFIAQQTTPPDMLAGFAQVCSDNIRIQAFVNGFEEDTGITGDQWVPPGVSYDQPIRTICKAYCAQYGHGECAPPSAPPRP